MGSGITGIIVCYATCWDCKFDHCPNQPHVWWDDEDVWDEKPEHTPPLPEGRCGCPCAREVECPSEPDVEYATAQ